MLLLPLISCSLRLRRFQKTKAHLEPDASPSSPQVSDPEQVANAVQKTCRMVRAAARYGFVRPTCLADSLALWHLLQKQGISANLRIGVRKSSHHFEAHAWVEHNGVALNQADEVHRHYAPFDRELSQLSGDRF